MAPTLKAAAIHAPAASGPRRAVFIDVENTSSEADLLRVLDDLHIDLIGGRTEVTAVGNWRVIGQQLGRTLAHRGAQLVHSAPAPRVSDWSDLWIAVSAGMWLGRAAAGDVIDIVSDDRAFDAVGDAAARIGVRFRRTTYRTGGAVATSSAEITVEPSGRRRGGRRRGGRRRGGRSGAAEVAATTSAPPAWTAPPRAQTPLEEPHAASQDHIRAIIARLTAAQPERGVSLDMLVTALKAEGFQRPPGSPRLITRLRRLKDVEVLPNGRVRLIGGAAEIASAALAAAEDGTVPVASMPAGDGDGSAVTAASLAQDGRAAAEGASPSASAKRRRSKRRGGRRGGARHRRSKAAAPQ